jgi:ribosomal protein RSM22 (predicted rRNA methylase)
MRDREKQNQEQLIPIRSVRSATLVGIDESLVRKRLSRPTRKLLADTADSVPKSTASGPTEPPILIPVSSHVSPRSVISSHYTHDRKLIRTMLAKPEPMGIVPTSTEHEVALKAKMYSSTPSRLVHHRSRHRSRRLVNRVGTTLTFQHEDTLTHNRSTHGPESTQIEPKSTRHRLRTRLLKIQSSLLIHKMRLSQPTPPLSQGRSFSTSTQRHTTDKDLSSSEQPSSLGGEWEPLQEFRRAVQRADPSEEAAIRARNEFGDALPEGYLADAELQVYTRLYGPPKPTKEVADEAEEDESHQLQRENEHGAWEVVVEEGTEKNPWLEEEDTVAMIEEPDESLELEEEADEIDSEALSPGDTKDLESQWQDDPEYVRTHPFTLTSRWGTSPSTIHIPKTTFTTPIASLLKSTHPKHLASAAETLFGGPGLPYSPSTPAISRTMEQKPIPLNTRQTKMSETSAELWMAGVMPQTYAAAMSVLVEVRKRLGSSWVRGLMEKDGGPLVLDVGGGGAGVLAWRDVVKAEWEALHGKEKDVNKEPVPYGKATVVTGSDTLRYRASRLLENTSFLPRMPDTVPDELLEGMPERKQYDIIIAPHSLWNLGQDWERKNTVETLWSLLKPDGGLLILIEKGVPRGFEAVAGARELLLTNHIQHPVPPPAPLEMDREDADDMAEIQASTSESTMPGSLKQGGKDIGMIVAPCTNHSTCPLYTVAGTAQGRKDWCFFRQRYIRPSFLQTILGARQRNHDDVEFSYLAVRRGVDLRREEQLATTPSPSTTQAPVEPYIQVAQNEESTDRAFIGYAATPASLAERIATDSSKTHADALDIFRDTEPPPTPEPAKGPLALSRTHDRTYWAQHSFHPLQLPRIILPPIKRKGHILIDCCTPQGTFERWLVNRRVGKQVWRDARKARWGDLWALGAWSREMRRVRVGTVNKKAERKMMKAGRGKKGVGRKVQGEVREKVREFEEEMGGGRKGE